MEENKKPVNPSHRQWVDLIILYFTTIKEYEDKIEPLRISLNQENNFSCKSLFNFLDNNSKNLITLDDFIKFLQDNSINYDEKYLRQFIHNYDKDNDFCLNYEEFKGMILPLTDDSFKQKVEEEDKKKEEIKINDKEEKDNEKEEKDKEKEEKDNEKEEKDKEKEEIKENEGEEQEPEKEQENNNIEKSNENNNIEKSNENNNIEKSNENNNIEKSNENNNIEENKKEDIDPKILSAFGEIIKEEMSLAEKLMEISKQCLDSKFFTFYESFKEIADEDKYITEENLNNFLQKNGVELNEKDPKGLMHRNDTDNDGKISFTEFKDIFFPINNVQYKRSLNDYNKYQNEYNSILRSGPANKNNYNYNNNNSSYYPSRNNNFKNKNYNNDYNNYSINNKTSYIPNNYTNNTYQSPKLKHTSSCLHYDYSTYADEDHDNYGSRNRNKRNRNSSIANLNNYPNTIYNNNYDCDYLLRRTCCGCPCTNYFVHSNNCFCCLCCEI